MKHASYLVPEPTCPATPHAEECLAKIKAMLAKPAEPPVEREPGEDWEEDNEPV